MVTACSTRSNKQGRSARRSSARARALLAAVGLGSVTFNPLLTEAAPLLLALAGESPFRTVSLTAPAIAQTHPVCPKMNGQRKCLAHPRNDANDPSRT